MLDGHPLLARPALGGRPKGRLAPVPIHGWGSLAHHIPRPGLIAMDDEMAIPTRHDMPRHAAHLHGTTAAAGARRAAFPDTLNGDPPTL